jgi:hypothetical protein
MNMRFDFERRRSYAGHLIPNSEGRKSTGQSLFQVEYVQSQGFASRREQLVQGQSRERRMVEMWKRGVPLVGAAWKTEKVGKKRARLLRVCYKGRHKAERNSVTKGKTVNTWLNELILSLELSITGNLRWVIENRPR